MPGTFQSDYQEKYRVYTIDYQGYFIEKEHTYLKSSYVSIREARVSYLVYPQTHCKYHKNDKQNKTQHSD